ncbi:MAG: hypothetical protein ABR552_04910, partial [Actinomycetota bacterium]
MSRIRVAATALSVLLIAAVAPARADGTWEVSTSIISGSVPGLPSSCEQPTSEGETIVSSEPGDRDHLVAEWSAGSATGSNTTITATSRDGGTTWTRSFIPGTGRCTGGPGDYVIDQWISVGRGGAAYYDTFVGHDSPPLAAQVLADTSSNGGTTWPAAAVIDDNLDGARGIVSRTSITADPDHEGSAWAVWSRLVNPAFQGIFVSHTTDGGQTWGVPVKAADVIAGAAAAWQLVVR